MYTRSKISKSIVVLALLSGCVTPAPVDRGQEFREQAQSAQDIENADKRAAVLADSLRRCADDLESVEQYYAEREHNLRDDYNHTISGLTQKIERLEERIKDLSDMAVDEAGATTDLVKWSISGAIGIGLLAVVGMVIWAYIKRGGII